MRFINRHLDSQESQLRELVRGYILIGRLTCPLKAEKRTYARLSAAPPPRGFQLDVALATNEYDE